MDPHTDVLITGAGGQVGTAMMQVAPGAIHATHSDLDVTDASSLLEAVPRGGTILHLAALTDVDRCEREPELAQKVNATATGDLVDAARSRGARIIFLSTDYVFDGTKAGEYTEADTPFPLSVYGRTKLEGERLVLADPHNLVVRASTIFGEGRNFVRSIAQLAATRLELTVVDDQVSRPTGAVDLARALGELVERPEVSGVLHVAGHGRPCSRAELAHIVLDEIGSRARVVGVTTQAFSSDVSPAPRPLNSSLALARAEGLGVPLFPWRSSLSAYVRTLL